MPHQTPRISVVIPTYNMAAWVTAAVQSVLNQGVAEVEVVVVDDGSTDDTAERLAAWADRIVVLRQANRGLAAARNAGVRLARAQLLVFLDADDRLRPGKLASQAHWLDKHPDVAAVYSDGLLVDAEGRVLNLISAEWPAGMFSATGAAELPRRLLRGLPFPPHCPMLRRSAAIAAGLFDESLRTREDLDFWLRLARRERFGFLPGVLVDYTVRAGSLSRTSEWMYRDTCRLYDAMLGSAEFSGRSAQEQAADLRAWALELALLHEGPWSQQRIQARRYAALARRLQPSALRAWVLQAALASAAGTALLRVGLRRWQQWQRRRFGTAGTPPPMSSLRP